MKLSLPTKFATDLIPLTLPDKIFMQENRNCKSFETASIDNLCEIVVAVNLKEYYEHFEDFRGNKKHKGMKKKRKKHLSWQLNFHK